MTTAPAVDMEKKWYVVHTYSGYEHKVKAALEERIRSLGKEEYFGEILVPAEKVVELVKGKKRTSSRKFFPGYILVNMFLNDDTWHVVCLHHASVQAPDHNELGGFVNEGIRVTSLRAFITGATFPAEQKALVDELFA